VVKASFEKVAKKIALADETCLTSFDDLQVFAGLYREPEFIGFTAEGGVRPGVYGFSFSHISQGGHRRRAEGRLRSVF
jgi:hypothetical protein